MSVSVYQGSNEIYIFEIKIYMHPLLLVYLLRAVYCTGYSSSGIISYYSRGSACRTVGELVCSQNYSSVHHSV